MAHAPPSVCLIVAALVAALAPPISTAAPSRFLEECVRLSIADGHLVVLGRSEFRAEGSPDSLCIVYPFAVDDDQGPPSLVFVGERTSKGRVGLDTHRWLDRAQLQAALHPRADGHFGFDIEFRQPLSHRRATYLLRTAAAWEEPIGQARFEVLWPDSLGVPRFSLPLRAAERGEGTTLYHYEVARFVPKGDLVIEW